MTGITVFNAQNCGIHQSGITVLCFRNDGSQSSGILKLTQGDVVNEKDLVLSIEYIGTLENQNAEIDGFISLWQEILESGISVNVSKK